MLRGGRAHRPGPGPVSTSTRSSARSPSPTCRWWCGSPASLPAPGDPLLDVANRLVVDSRAVAEGGADALARASVLCRRLPVSDLSWIRLRPWRTQLAGLFEGGATRPFLDAVDQVEVVGNAGPRLMMGGWLLRRLRPGAGPRPAVGRRARLGEDRRHVRGPPRPVLRRPPRPRAVHRRVGRHRRRADARAGAAHGGPVAGRWPWPAPSPRSATTTPTRTPSPAPRSCGTRRREPERGADRRRGRGRRVLRACRRGLPHPPRRELLAGGVRRRDGPALLRETGGRRVRPARLVAGRRLLGRRAVRPTRPPRLQRAHGEGGPARAGGRGQRRLPDALRRRPRPVPAEGGHRRPLRPHPPGPGARRPHRLAVPRLAGPRRRPRPPGRDERGPRAAATPTAA